MMADLAFRQPSLSSSFYNLTTYNDSKAIISIFYNPKKNERWCRKNDYESAMFHFQQLLQNKPDYWVALARLVEVMRRTGTASVS
jgi:hypothetical protein